MPEHDDGAWAETLKGAKLAEDDVPAGCSRFPLCMGDHLDECVVLNENGKVSGTKSMIKYYKLKKSLFKKPFRYRRESYPFALLDNK